MSGADTNIWVPACRHHMPAYGRQDRGDISTTYLELRRVDKWQRHLRANNKQGIGNMRSPGLELWSISDLQLVDNLVHEKMGWVRRRFAFVPEAAVLAQVPRRTQTEPPKVPHIHEFRRHFIFELWVKEIHTKNPDSLCDVPDHRRKRYYVRIPNRILRNASSLPNTIPYPRQLCSKPEHKVTGGHPLLQSNHLAVLRQWIRILSQRPDRAFEIRSEILPTRYIAK